MNRPASKQNPNISQGGKRQSSGGKGKAHRKWPTRSDSHLEERINQEKRESGFLSGNRTYLKCNLGPKVGYTGNGGPGSVGVGVRLSQPIDYPNTFTPYLCHLNGSLKPVKSATKSLFLVMPITAADLYKRLCDHSVSFRYKTFVKICLYVHSQRCKTKSQDLDGLFETSGDEAKRWVKKLSVSGQDVALPKVLDDIGLTRAKRGYTPGEQALRREFVGGDGSCFEILPYETDWISREVEPKLKGMYKGFFERPELVWVKDSYSKLSFRKTDLKDVSERYTQSKENNEWGFHHKKLADRMLEGKPSRLSFKRGGVYVEARSLPSKCRLRGFFDFGSSIERVCLVDMKSSHPMFLTKVLDDYLQKQQDKGVIVDNAMYELGKYAKLISNGTLYESIQGPEKRKDSKLKFQKWLNGEGWHYKEIDDWFRRSFAELHCIIRGFKKNDTKSDTPIHKHLRRIEADVVMRMIQHCKGFGIPVVPIIDELMVPESKGRMIAEVMLNVIDTQNGIKGRATIDYYDETETNCVREVVVVHPGIEKY